MGVRFADMEWARWGCRQTGFRYVLYGRDTPESLLSLWRKAPTGKSGSPTRQRGVAIYFGHEGREYAYRHYYRGGWPARWIRDRYFWLGLARSRPWRELALLAEMNQEGLPVPLPVLAIVDRTGLWGYRADLVTRRLEGVSLVEAIRSGQPIDWARIGQTIRRFHNLGIQHADLNAGNIWLVPGGGVYLLDFDRARRHFPGTSYFFSRSLRRLRRSLEKQPGGSQHAGTWDALIRLGYAREETSHLEGLGSVRSPFGQLDLHGQDGSDPSESGSD